MEFLLPARRYGIRFKFIGKDNGWCASCAGDEDQHDEVVVVDINQFAIKFLLLPSLSFISILVDAFTACCCSSRRRRPFSVHIRSSNQ
jgi:hypothetical protein